MNVNVLLIQNMIMLVMDMGKDVKNGYIYEGEFNYGLSDGNGIYYYTNGSLYEGKYKKL